MLVFEPVPGNADNIKKLFENNPLVTVHAVAVSEKNGELTLYTSRECHANPSLINQSWWDVNNRCEWKEIKIPARTIDSYNIEEDVYLFKVDVQGYELGVFQGAEKLFAANKVNYVFTEFWPTGLF